MKEVKVIMEENNKVRFVMPNGDEYRMKATEHGIVVNFQDWGGSDNRMVVSLRVSNEILLTGVNTINNP